MSRVPYQHPEGAELNQLIDAYLDGFISDEQHERLCSLIRSDTAHARSFARRSVMHRRLRELMVLDQDRLMLTGLDLENESFIDQLSSLDDTNHDAQIVDVTDQVLEQKKQRKRNQRRAERQGLETAPRPIIITIPKPLALAALIAVAVLIGVVVVPLLDGPSQEPGMAEVQPDEQTAVEPSPDPDPLSPPPSRVATLTQSYKPVWSKHSQQPMIGDRVAVGSYQLESGAVIISFDRGATTLIQGPAQFEVVNDNRGQIASGQLTANVPPQAIGFTIDTPTSQVVDFGTEFGVAVDTGGQTLAAVFTGLVELSEKPTEENADPAKIPLSAGYQAEVDADARLKAEAEPIEPTHPFARDMADVRYRPQIRGDAEYLREPPASVTIGQLVSKERMRITLEQTGVELKRGISGLGFVALPGRYSKTALRKGNGSIQPGRTLDSYLVHYDSGLGDDDSHQGKPPVITATFVFPRPIAGVMTDGLMLYETDVLFAHPMMELPTRSDLGAEDSDDLGGFGRGLEYKSAPEVVTISDDRRAVTLTLSAVLIDQVRILTQPAD